MNAIVVESLSKQFHIGHLAHSTMLREALVNLLSGRAKSRNGEARTIWALRDVCFEVPEGEVVGIIGRNGAGKSTLLKVLSRITRPTSGEVKVKGRVASLLEVGTGFHEELTGRENIYLSGSILGMSKRKMDARLDSIIAFAGVDKFIDTPIKRYSTGMRLRLGFAVSAHLEPDILLVDEVLAVGDGEFQKKCLKAMDDLHTAGRTVLFVSHNLAAVEHLCSRALWIDNGRIKQDGKAKEVIEAYMSTFSERRGTGLDLRRVESRRGVGDIRYTRIEFLTRGREPENAIRSGQSLAVRLHYEAHTRIVNPIFSFEIYTRLGTLITKVSTWHSGFDIPVIEKGAGYIDAEVDCLNLMPGEYSLSLLIEDPSGDPAADYDFLDHCTALSVEPSDFHGSGRGMGQFRWIVCLGCKWDLSPV